ncbi:hypothetical protein AQS70_08100 [Pseudomonas endophytica]|uniref:DUF3077 domain-containing protein n=1 Tax=Pseudomonas endophytica TaxID=1563157 RepID=A0A0Q0XA06_9PSED|nr:hypothetical protein [Pseudomonas endophytica]KQB54022.1 hypothetical protein AQS70_08100 [Pseudomonas endophytica]
MKNPTPAGPKPKRTQRDDHQHDDATRQILKRLQQNPRANVDTLKPTQAHEISPQSPFTVQADVRALEALQHVSIMLKSAEEVSDEITELASGVERGLVWSLVHSVEMARSLVDALLKGNGIDPEKTHPTL